MTNDEVNRYLHEQVMEKCWHRMVTARTCSKCGVHKYDPGHENYNYCSDDSPRSLLNAVVLRVKQQCRLPVRFRLPDIFENEWGMPATAEQIARVCVQEYQKVKAEEKQ